jgi:serine/threonine protein phosphatase 1
MGAAVLVAIHSLVDFSLEIQAVALLFVVMLALGSAQSLDAAPPREPGTGKPRAASHASQRQRLTFDAAPHVIYAIGDVHGELDLLLELEARIVADARTIPGEKWIILLGDLIDRGPHSAHVIDHMLDAPPPGFRRFCIAGNHEIMMLKAIENPAFLNIWLRNGGVDTLASYGIGREQMRGSKGVSASAMMSLLPREHLDFLAALPVAIETPEHLFVHAGMTPGKPLSQQGDNELTLTGREFLDLPIIHQKVIVHGHHVVQNACYRNNRISIDTGAYLSGRLAAVRIESGGQFRFLAGPSANP